MLFEGYFQIWAGAVFTVIAHPRVLLRTIREWLSAYQADCLRTRHDSTVTST
jgi:hypothetical protein